MSDFPWGDTPFPDLNFNEDCAASGRYVASALGGVEEPSFTAVTSFFEAVVPGSSDLNVSAAAEWHRFLLQDRDFHDLWWDVRDELGGGLMDSKNFNRCIPDLCDHITRSLPNDVIGIGLLVAVTIEFLLVIGYCAAALHPYITKMQPASGSGPLHRVLHAFHSTKGHFFHLAIILSVGVSIAVIYDGAATLGTDAYASASSQRSYYGAGGPLMGAVFFPLAATIPSYLWNSRRQWRDGALAAVAWVLISAAILMIPDNWDTRQALQAACPAERFPSDVNAVTSPAVHGLATWTPALLLIILGIAVSCFKCSGKRMWGWRPLRLVLRWLVAIYAGIGVMGAISFTIILLVYASKTTWAVRNWGLGQGIALVFWIPLVYEIIYVAVVGIDRGLEERLPLEFHATRGPETESEAGLDHASSSRPRGGEDPEAGPSSAVDLRKLSAATSTGGGAYA